MGEIQKPKSVLLITAVVSKYDDALAWAEKRLTEAWGPVAIKSEAFAFVETDFYESEMGTNLKKQFLAFERTIDPANVADCKLASNELEKLYAESFDHPEVRPLNLDPGYITDAKLVLATTKNRDHRIYLRDGIFAEVTLHHRKNGIWAKNRWTYPDYQREDFHAYFNECREFLRASRR